MLWYRSCYLLFYWNGLAAWRIGCFYVRAVGTCCPWDSAQSSCGWAQSHYSLAEAEVFWNLIENLWPLYYIWDLKCLGSDWSSTSSFSLCHDTGPCSSYSSTRCFGIHCDFKSQSSNWVGVPIVICKTSSEEKAWCPFTSCSFWVLSCGIAQLWCLPHWQGDCTISFSQHGSLGHSLSTDSQLEDSSLNLSWVAAVWGLRAS